jgi:hyperosmotically inducible periplasmic protein
MLRQQSARGAINDGLITAKIRAALTADPITADYEISVETLEGVVLLAGFVETAIVRAEALQVAQHVEGVLRVDDSLDLRRFD